MKKNWLSHFIELIIVIAGVSIAFWLNQISEDRKAGKIRGDYLMEIREDLNSDRQKLKYSMDYNTKKKTLMIEVAGLFSDAEKNKNGILEGALTIGNLGFFTAKDFTYKSMIASGDFKLLDNSEIKRALIALYTEYENIDNLQVNFVQALDDNYFPYLMDNFDYLTFTTTNDDFHNSGVLRNFVAFTVNELGQHVDAYERASLRVEKLDSLILAELPK